MKAQGSEDATLLWWSEALEADVINVLDSNHQIVAQ